MAYCRSETGADISSILQNAFDGNTATKPDSGTVAHGPVGLVFGCRAWVTRFGYICRNDNYCWERIKNAALFSASADDTTLAQKVRRSQVVQQGSQTTTLYFQDTTSLPSDGAEQWFLWAENFTYAQTFHGNVAELMFFGWTEDDIRAAGIVTAPTALTFTRAMDGRSVAVAWTAGANASGYRIERRARGADAWNVLGTTTGDVTTWSDATMTQGALQYRAVALGIDDEAPSTMFDYTYYVPGDGMGLTGALYAPFIANDARYCMPTNRWALPVGNVALRLPPLAEFVEGSGVTNNARLLWRGALIVPITGSYTFTLETSDGGAVYIDNETVCNSWTGGSKTFSGTTDLTAGEHAIEVDARLQGTYQDMKTCVLRWSGTVPDDVVPATQLKPAAAEATLDIDGWIGSALNGSRLGKVTRSGNGYLIKGPNENLGTRDAFNATFLSKPWRYSFDLSARVRTVMNGRAMIMARGRKGDLYAVYYDYDGGGNGYYGTYAITNGTSAIGTPGGRTSTGIFSDIELDLRLTYDFPSRLFTAWWKEESETEWRKVHEWTNDGSIAGEYDFGFATSGRSTNKESSYTFTNIQLETKRMGLTLVIR